MIPEDVLSETLRNAQPAWKGSLVSIGFSSNDPAVNFDHATIQFEEQPQPMATPELSQAVGEAGGVAGEIALKPFQLVYFVDDSDAHKVRVKYSTLVSEAPTSPTPETNLDYIFSFTAGNKVYAKLTINGTTGAATARILATAATVPTNTNTEFHELIGSMIEIGDIKSVTNTRYGPIAATICRNWFASAAPYYGVTFS